jgi:hypothetical protein
MRKENEIKSALKEAILKSLPSFQKLSDQCQEDFVFWSKDGSGWRGTPQKRPSLFHVFNNGRNLLAENAVTFNNLFFSNYPEYDAGHLISCGGFGHAAVSRQSTRYGKTPIR